MRAQFSIGLIIKMAFLLIILVALSTGNYVKNMPFKYQFGLVVLVAILAYYLFSIDPADKNVPKGIVTIYSHRWYIVIVAVVVAALYFLALNIIRNAWFAGTVALLMSYMSVKNRKALSGLLLGGGAYMGGGEPTGVIGGEGEVQEGQHYGDTPSNAPMHDDGVYYPPGW